MRGSRYSRRCRHPKTRSIPAHAGEPLATALRTLRARVYPRACGGASPRPHGKRFGVGLSPRMRGSLSQTNNAFEFEGSIPAHAGEPRPLERSDRLLRVYPRACGGASHDMLLYVCERGLSPRMRGSQDFTQPLNRREGSIPAHAGEPAEVEAEERRPRVYPRACGGAAEGKKYGLMIEGLSPRMRGSRVDFAGAAGVTGSIPAHAGEPRRNHYASAAQGVYPRACGGAAFIRWKLASDTGLSPRMRGSLLHYK